MWPIESPLRLIELPTSDHCSHSECEIRRMTRRVDQQPDTLQCRSATSAFSTVVSCSGFDRYRTLTVAFARAVISLHGTVWNFGEYGAKRDFASATTLAEPRRPDLQFQFLSASSTSESTYPNIFAHYENIDRFSWRRFFRVTDRDLDLLNFK